MQTTAPVLVLVAFVSGPSVSAAQSPGASQPDVVAELRALRAELTEARNELQKLRADVDQLKGAPPQAEPAVPLSTAVEILQSQVAEHAQTKVESASRMPLKILGTIHSTVASNSGEANWLDNPNIVAAAPPRTGLVQRVDATNPVRRSRRGSRPRLVARKWRGRLRFFWRDSVVPDRAGDGSSASRVCVRSFRARRHGPAGRSGRNDAGAAKSKLRRRHAVSVVVPLGQSLSPHATGPL